MSIKNLKNEIGITLIALVITIIVLLILAGVSIASLTGENGILTKANSAEEEHLMSQYKEELNLIIAEEKAIRSTENTEEPLIKSLDDKINKKEWVKGTLIEEKEHTKNLIIQTKEGYEFIIEIEEEKQIAKIISESKQLGNYRVILEFNANEGTGTIESIETAKDQEVKIPQNIFTREKYRFIGWNTKKDGTGQSYSSEEMITIKENTTLYAMWEYAPLTISFDANGGEGVMNNLYFQENVEMPTPINQYTKEGYEFCGWKTSDNKWFVDRTMSTTTDLALVAQWVPTEKAYYQGFERGIALPPLGDVRNTLVDGNFSSASDLLTLTGYSYIKGTSRLNAISGSRTAFQYIYQGTQTYNLTSNSNTDTWVVVWIYAGSWTTGVSFGQFKLIFSNEAIYTLQEAVSNDYIEDFYVCATDSRSTSYLWTNLNAIPSGGNTSTANYCRSCDCI